MKIGYKACRSCGSVVNVADLVSGLCPTCADAHVSVLSEYQREYEAAAAAGEPGASARVAELISEYERSERVRLRDAYRIAGRR